MLDMEAIDPKKLGITEKGEAVVMLDGEELLKQAKVQLEDWKRIKADAEREIARYNEIIAKLSEAIAK